MWLVKSAVHALGKWYNETICKKEYDAQHFTRLNERPIEYGFVFRQLVRACPTTILDVGTGTTAFPHLLENCGFVVTAVDNKGAYWNGKMFNRHYHVINDDITKTTLKKKFDFITCVSVLEHIKMHDEAIKSMFSLLEAGGSLALTIPYNEGHYVEDVYRSPSASYGENLNYVCQVFSRDQIIKWLDGQQCEIIEQEYWQFFTGEFWTFGEQLAFPKQVDKDQLHHLTCILFRKN